ncbi:hypothetical protein CPB86DRAFT_793307 [Serendipita vermifera]|nr:hypothetical protein CPB86DRAFT_793307 [Serendipita vermifera]
MADELATYSALLTQVASTVETGRYCTLASWILLLYDHIIHLDKEVELFWMKKWSVAKGLYLFPRLPASGPHTLGSSRDGRDKTLAKVASATYDDPWENSCNISHQVRQPAITHRGGKTEEAEEKRNLERGREFDGFISALLASLAVQEPFVPCIKDGTRVLSFHQNAPQASRTTTSPYSPSCFKSFFLNPHVTDRLCLAWFEFEGYTGVSGIAAVELILGFRVLALWNRNKIVLGIVAFAFFAEIATMLGILTSTYVNMGAVSTIIPGVPYKACVPLNITPYFFAFWLPPLGYESIVFLLAATKGYMTIRHAFTNFTFRATGSRLLEVMIRDSLWYFLLIIACDVACSVIWLKGPDSLLQAVVGFGLVIPSVAASHLLINLRDAYYHPTGVTTAGASRTYDLPTFNRPRDFPASGGRSHVRKDGDLDTQWALDATQDGMTVFCRGEVESNIARAHATIGETQEHASTRSDLHDPEADRKTGGQHQNIATNTSARHHHNVGTVTSSTVSITPDGDRVTDEVYELDHVPSRLHTRVQYSQTSTVHAQTTTVNISNFASTSAGADKPQGF